MVSQPTHLCLALLAGSWSQATFYAGQFHVWKYRVTLSYTLKGSLPSGRQSFPAKRLPPFQMSPPSGWCQATWKTHRRPSAEPFLWGSAPRDGWRWRMECQWVPSRFSQPGAGLWGRAVGHRAQPQGAVGMVRFSKCPQTHASIVIPVELIPVLTGLWPLSAFRKVMWSVCPSWGHCA